MASINLAFLGKFADYLFYNTSHFLQAPEKFTHVTKFVRDYLGTLESNTYVFRDSQQNKLTYEVNVITFMFNKFRQPSYSLAIGRVCFHSKCFEKNRTSAAELDTS